MFGFFFLGGGGGGGGGAYLHLQWCSCVHAHVILYMSVLEARISAIMRIGNFNIY